jgi:hypothetical protein
MNKLVDYSVTMICVFGIIGFAFGFTKWFNYDGNTLANLPVFPNMLDSIFLFLSASYLGIRIMHFKNRVKKMEAK